MAMNITTKKDAFDDFQEDGKVIINPRIARAILKEGGEDVRIIDLKPLREDKDEPDKRRVRTCYVFKKDAKFEEVFSKVLAKNEERKAAMNESMADEGGAGVDAVDSVAVLKEQMRQLREQLEKLAGGGAETKGE